MRSPPEVPYLFALESAMDELAVKLNMDPIELRRVNDTMKEPIGGKPYTSRSLMACFDEGAKAFGWSQRSAAPQSMAEGDWLIGYGCATTCYPTQMAPAAARVRLQRDGRARHLGIGVDRVTEVDVEEVVLGDHRRVDLEVVEGGHHGHGVRLGIGVAREPELDRAAVLGVWGRTEASHAALLTSHRESVVVDAIRRQS